MKREIKFRGKSKRNGEWLYGDLVRNVEGAFAVVPPFEVNLNNCCERYEVDKYTIGQFTGFLDINGKDIYEGDILQLEDEYELYVVEWHDAGLKARQISNPSTIGLTNWRKYITVIGNIYDNQYLLKGGRP